MRNALQSALAPALLAVLLWSTVATAFKLALAAMQPLQLLAGASATSTVVLLLWLLGSGQLRALAGAAAEWRRAALLGLLNPAAYYLVLFAAYDRLPAQVAQPLNYTWAITMSLLAVPLLGQRLGRSQLLALVLAWCGVLVIATGANPGRLQVDDGLGVALALASTVLWALYWLLGTRQAAPPAVALTRCFLCGTPLVLTLCLLGPGWPDWHPVAVPAMLWVGLFEMGLTFLLWGTAMRRTDNAAGISQLVFLAPFLSLVFIHLLLGEPLRLATLPGLVLIVGGLLLQARAQPSSVGNRSR